MVLLFLQNFIIYSIRKQQKMFLTQADHPTLWNRKKTILRSKSQYRNKFEPLSSISSECLALGSRKNSLHRTFNITELIKDAQNITPETKWNKIVDLYNMPVKSTGQEQPEIKTIRPGLCFYKLLTNQVLLQKHKLKINFPETFIQVSGDLIQVSTNFQSGELQARKVQREHYSSLMSACLQNEIKKIKQFSTNNKELIRKPKQENSIRYKEHYDYRKNSFAPVVITKMAQQSGANFEVDVQNFKNFNERRSRPSSNKIVQRYIYSRNMRAMIMRICYSRKKLGEQKEEFYAYRFQNVDNIFRVNKKNNQIYETFKAQSIISATYDREDKIEYSKIINMKGLEKYIQPSKQLIKFLEVSQKIKVNELYVDYICDLLDKPWLINIKRIQYENSSQMGCIREKMSDHKFSLHIAGSYGICRLCSIEYLKKNLKKSISNKMLCEFLSHLKKRMKVSEYERLEFVNDIIRKNIKNYITLQVCDSCYRTVAEEYRLIESEQKLAKICNIQSQIETNQAKSKCLNLPNKLKQWRLMIYFVGISNIPQQLLKEQDQVLLRYKLGNGDAAEHTWKISVSYKTNSSNFYGNFNVDLNIKKVKIHYFYSESLDISDFLKETEISLQLATVQEQKIFAKGSSGSLSCFSTQFTPDLCLRQTSSVLLFYNNGAYCEMTFKIGLTCDGLYQLTESICLTPLNKVYFADSNFTNANAIPKEWMEAFGVSRDIQIPQASYESIMKPHIDDRFIELLESSQSGATCQKNKSRNKYLGRKSLHLLR